MTVVAPMPRDNVRTAVMVNSGLRRIVLNA
jgi:hypothetical protein